MLKLLENLAQKYSDGHFTIMKFTTNWRVSFSTPEDREDRSKMFEGKTLEEAVEKAIKSLN